MKTWIAIGSLCVSLWLPFPVKAAVPWEVAGQATVTFVDTDSLAANVRIEKLNGRLKEIVIRLNPRNSWRFDLAPIYETRKEKDNKGKEKKVKVLQSIVIQLEGTDLIEVTESDIKAHNAESLEMLAQTWLQSLQELFQKAEVRQFLTISFTSPEKLVYNGKTYILKPEVAPDRGLFRTTGKQVEGNVIFWEVPANERTYILDRKTRQEWENAQISSDRIFIFNQNLQFIPYLLENQNQNKK